MNDLIDKIHEKRMALLRDFNKNAQVVILGRKTFDDIRNEAHKNNITVYQEPMDYNQDPKVFGVRIVVSNEIEEITVL